MKKLISVIMAIVLLMPSAFAAFEDMEGTGSEMQNAVSHPYGRTVIHSKFKRNYAYWDRITESQILWTSHSVTLLINKTLERG